MPEQNISYAQNGEDIVLWRALGHIEGGCYVDIGANDPTVDSISRIFYDHGWSGVTVEPVPEYAGRHREQRPRDLQLEAVLTDQDVTEVALHSFGGTGLSTLVDEIADGHEGSGFERTELVVRATTLQAVVDEHLGGRDVHFCCIDVEGAEESVLRSADLRRFRPWVFVVEATLPRSREQVHHHWEPMLLEAGYQFCLFDGLSRFYVAAEHAAELADELSVPASSLDDFESLQVAQLKQHLELSRNHGAVMQDQRDNVLRELSGVRTEFESLRTRTAGLDQDNQALRGQVLHWRRQVMAYWADAASGGGGSRGSADVNHELDRIRNTVSWRVTAPLRAVRRRMPR